MRSILLIFFVAAFIFSCRSPSATGKQSENKTTAEETSINNMLDSFNRAAALADYNRYFSFYADGAIFTGTDATERWDKAEFMAWAKPFFDRGKAWDFTSMERHIYFDSTGSLAWFDELLNTQMKICRGSGVVEKQGDEWKIKQYILSATVPNDIIDSVVQMKAPAEDSILQRHSLK